MKKVLIPIFISFVLLAGCDEEHSNIEEDHKETTSPSAVVNKDLNIK